MDDYLTAQETHAAREENDARKAESEFDLIKPSAATSETVQPNSERALGKRPRPEATTEDQGYSIELGEEDEIP